MGLAAHCENCDVTSRTSNIVGFRKKFSTSVFSLKCTILPSYSEIEEGRVFLVHPNPYSIVVRSSRQPVSNRELDQSRDLHQLNKNLPSAVSLGVLCMFFIRQFRQLCSLFSVSFEIPVMQICILVLRYQIFEKVKRTEEKKALFFNRLPTHPVVSASGVESGYNDSACSDALLRPSEISIY